MRDFRGVKRQRGRNRKPGSGGTGGGGGGGGGNNPNRAFESNGPEGMKIRGNAQHVYERYQQMARDAFTSGDRVLAESHLQHAEHYFRVLRTLQPSRPVSEIAARDAFASGFDIDFEDESGDQAMEGDMDGDMDGDRQNGDRQNGDRQNGDRQNDRQQNDRQQNQGRDNNGRDDYRRDRDDREPRENREFGGEPRRDFGEAREGEAQSRDGQPREGQNRDGQPREGQNREGGRRDRKRFDRRNEEGGRNRDQDQGVNPDPLAVVEPRGSDFPTSQPAPRGVAEDDSHLPAFLRQPSAPVAADEGGERPRRAPRRRRSSEDEGGAPQSETAEEDA